MKKGLETYLYTTVGVVAFLAIIIAVNFIGGRAKVRMDLTQDKAYTLSEGTRAILAKLDTPVQMRFYCSRGDNTMPVQLKNYAQSVEDLLGEFRLASKGQIEIQKLDPTPTSDAEDSAKLDGVEGQQLDRGGEALYFGLSVTMLDQKEVIPFFDPRREKLTEYDIARAVTRVITPTKPVIGIMSPLPVNGSGNPMMMRMGRGGEPAWAFASELKRDFTVKTIEMTADKIPDDVKVLLVIHPKGITDVAQYAIDQFVLRGGKLIAYLDPLSALDRAAGGPMGGASSSNLEKLLKTWGLTFDSTKVVADMNYVSQMQQGRSPAVLSLTEQANNKVDLLTASAGNLFLPFAGAFTGSVAEGLRMTTLIKSSGNSQLIDPMSAQMGGEQIITDFKPSGTEFNLAVRIEGKFKTAFPDGKPKAPEPKPEEGKPEEKKPETPAEPGLKEATAEATVLLIGDSDFMQDPVCMQVIGTDPRSGQRIQMLREDHGNLPFAQAGVEQLSGDTNLIKVRSRVSRERPFTVVKKMQSEAEATFQAKIKELQTDLQATQTKINELQRTKTDAGQRFIASPEQQAEKLKFEKKSVEVSKAIKAEEKKLKAGVESLANKTKWLNILTMPLIVSAAGVILALKRRKLQAAR